MSFLNKLNNAAHAVGEFVTPVLRTSAFKERGVLTPDEFVIAGDQLTRTCPTWEWASGDTAKRRSYLPAEKQFLITRGVACEQRIKSLEDQYGGEVEMEGVDGCENDTWLGTHINRITPAVDDSEAMDLASMACTIDSLDKTSEPSVHNTETSQEKLSGKSQSEKEYGFIDLDEFVEEGLDSSVVRLSTTTRSSNKSPSKRNIIDSEGSIARSRLESQKSLSSTDDVVAMRTYDISITYDKYYQTPRIWLVGYDENQRPLTGEEQMEDVMQDYANKTVTIEPHPLIAGDGACFASIHPCKHAEVMKKIISMLSEGGKSTEPRQYLFLFLKFIQSVIPTINYDNTIEVQGM